MVTNPYTSRLGWFHWTMLPLDHATCSLEGLDQSRMKLGNFRCHASPSSEHNHKAQIDEENREHQDPSVRVTAGETLALLMHASRSNRAWLSDFADETLMVSRDLYEILLAYKRIATEERSRAA